MSKKGIIAIGVIAVIIIGAGVGFALGRDKKPEAETTQTVSTSVESTQENTSVSQTEPVSEEVTQSISEYPFLSEGCWYIYNDNLKSAIAFMFEDEDDVTIAYFDEANVMGEDSKYFEGDADYKIVDGNIMITDVPEVVGADTIMLSVNGETLTHGDITLEHYDELSLEPPFDHFN